MNIRFTGMYDKTAAYAPGSPNWQARVEGITRQISEDVTKAAQAAREAGKGIGEKLSQYA